jgi:hypothetical protein
LAVIEGEGVVADCANSKKRRLLANTPRPRRPGWAEHARVACGREGGGGAGWAERPDGPAGRWADWAKSEGKILFRIKFDF